MTTRAAPLIEVSTVRKSYESDAGSQGVLDGLSLEINAGEMVSIMGPSGCGKTTLLNLIGALDSPDSGRITSCGIDLTSASASERTLTAYRARSVGFIFQFYNLLPTLSAEENVEAGITIAGVTRREARRRARRTLERVGLLEASRKFPGQLSGGEQQRVAIARALAKEPAVVLADEPTGNLDEDSGERVMSLIANLNVETQVTFVIVTHNPAISALAKRTVHLAHGRIAEGTAP